MSKKRTETEKRLECMIWRLARRVGKAHRLLAEFMEQSATGWNEHYLEWYDRVERFLKDGMKQ